MKVEEKWRAGRRKEEAGECISAKKSDMRRKEEAGECSRAKKRGKRAKARATFS